MFCRAWRDVYFLDLLQPRTSEVQLQQAALDLATQRVVRGAAKAGVHEGAMRRVYCVLTLAAGRIKNEVLVPREHSQRKGVLQTRQRTH